jgi:hypothetical protein
MSNVRRYVASSPPLAEQIATSSVEEGLDFACSLLSSAMSAEGDAHPQKAQQLLRELASYMQLRYVGERLLALEHLAGLGRACNPGLFRSEQFWSQLRWVAGEMRLTSEELENLELPNA